MKKLAALAIALLLALPVAAADLKPTFVQPLNSSVRIGYEPFPGAVDYRVCEKGTNDCKYAGLVHLTAAPGCAGDHAYDLTNTSCYRHFLANPDGTVKFPLVAAGAYGAGGAAFGPTGYDGPVLEIEWNGAGDGQPHTLVLQAVDKLGPVPYMNLYRETDIKAFTALYPMGSMEGMMLGSNKGPTRDGKISTNGQGPETNNPAVLASVEIVVQANRTLTPILPGATQVFLDTFENTQASSLVQLPGNCEAYTNDRGDWGGREWTLNAGTAKAWHIIARQIDCTNTMPFIMSNHFMDMLADRDLTIYGSLSMTPDQTFDISGGRILHMTQEVDDVMFGDRWMDFNIAPASDPLVHWNHQDAALNSSNNWLFMMNFGPYSQFGAQLMVSNGPSGNPTTPGAAVKAWSTDIGGLHDPRTFAPNGIGFDNKRRWDFFLSATYAQLYVDGRLIQEGPVDAPWLNQPIKVYFSHYLYHSEAGWKSMLTSGQGYPPGFCNMPALASWFNDPENGIQAGTQVTAITNGQRIAANGYGQNNCKQSYLKGFGYRNTDERHWDNMGASVLPAGTAWGSLAALVQPPPRLAVGTPPVVIPPVIPPVTPPVTPPAGISVTSPTQLPAGTVGASYSATLAATGGVAPYRWTVLSGALPAGLSMSTAGVVSGTPSAAAAATFGIAVEDAGSGIAYANFALNVAGVVTPPPVVRYEVPGSPVYTVRANGTRNTTAVAGVRVPAPTPCAARLGTTNYFYVTGQKDTKGRTLGPVVAACTPVE